MLATCSQLAKVRVVSESRAQVAAACSFRMMDMESAQGLQAGQGPAQRWPIGKGEGLDGGRRMEV